jgi:hypothetical protein
MGDGFNIIIGPKYLSCSDDLQLFIIWHERGHYESGHLAEQMDIKLYPKKRSSGMMIQQEFEADKYSRNKVGKDIAINSLNELKSYVENEYKNKSYDKKTYLYSLDELDQRIDQINRNQ